MTGPRFVSVSRDALLGELGAIGDKVAAAGGSFEVGQQGQEVVFDLNPPGARVTVRVYTTLAIGDAEVRECGEDAVRIVVLGRDANGTRAIEEGVKVLRTAPRGTPASRQEAFLGRLRDRVRDAYRLAVRRPACPSCGRAMARRATRDGARQFFGCIGYPECRGTAPVGGV